MQRIAPTLDLVGTPQCASIRPIRHLRNCSVVTMFRCHNVPRHTHPEGMGTHLGRQAWRVRTRFPRTQPKIVQESARRRKTASSARCSARLDLRFSSQGNAGPWRLLAPSPGSGTTFDLFCGALELDCKLDQSFLREQVPALLCHAIAIDGVLTQDFRVHSDAFPNLG